MKGEQGADTRMHPEIPGFLRAVEVSAPLRSSHVNAALARAAEVRAASIHKRQDRSVIEEHASVTGTARPFTRGAGQSYHDRRANSAAIDV